MPAPTIVVIGAGSASFGLHTIGGVLQEGPTLRGATLRLVDVDDAKLQTMSSFACRASAEFDGGLTVEATTDRRAALSEADFVIISVEVDRYPTEEKDWEIPLAHGIKHVFGQNGGAGGLFIRFGRSRSLSRSVEISRRSLRTRWFSITRTHSHAFALR